MIKKVSDLYNAPVIIRSRAGNEIDIIYEVRLTNYEDEKDAYVAQQQFSPQEETIENISKEVSKMTYTIMGKIQMDINNNKK